MRVMKETEIIGDLHILNINGFQIKSFLNQSNNVHIFCKTLYMI